MNYQQKAAQLKSITAELSKINKRCSPIIKVSPEVEHFIRGHYHVWAGIDDHDYFFDNFVYKQVVPGLYEVMSIRSLPAHIKKQVNQCYESK